jgi:transcriptional regulator with XRE-family HTH domain
MSGATRSPPVPATPLEIARYGHVAALLRAELEKRQWTPRQFNEAMGEAQGHSSIYKWLAAKAAPSQPTAKKIGKVLGIPWLQLLKAEDATPGTALTLAPERGPAPVRPVELLHFSVLNDGTTRLRLDMTAPADRGVALLRLLIDAGMVVAAEGSAR